MNNMQLAQGFLDAAKICLRHALEVQLMANGLDYFAVERMVQEAIDEVTGKKLYCDIHS